MEQVLVLNGLASLVDTRGTGASCAQSTDGTVSCLDTPLGLSAAQAAKTGGETAAYVASRLDVLAQESRAQGTEATVRADELAAAASSALQIGDFGSASVAQSASEAARIQSRAAFAQSAAAAVAAQAVRVGNAEQARMAGDAVVAAAWRGETAEVQAGALRGLGVDPTPSEDIVIKAGSTKLVPDVGGFSIEPSDIAAGQNTPAGLKIFAAKAGTATLTYKTRGGKMKRSKIVVAGMTPAQAIKAGQELWEKISNILGEPVLQIDWQDASAIRANADAILRVLATLRNASDRLRSTGANFEARQLYSIVTYIKQNPQVTTLRQAVLGVIPEALTTVSLSRSGRECRIEGPTTYRPLWAFARDYGTFTDVAGIVAVSLVAVAGAVATVFSAGAAAPGAAAALGITISAATATLVAGAAAAVGAAATALANAMPTFAADPDRLVQALGGAVCAAINDNAQPRRARFADKYRAQAVAAARQYQIAMAFANAPGVSAEARSGALAKAAEVKAQGQAALASMLGVDSPNLFTPEVNRTFEAAKAVLNKDDALGAGGDGTGAGAGGGGSSTSTGGGGGAIVAVGAAAAAFALWKFLR